MQKGKAVITGDGRGGMMRLIDADALEPSEVYMNYGFTRIVYMDDIDEMPTIDAEPIRHGKWIPLYPHDVPITNEYKCSVCGLGFDEDEETECVVYDTFKYCPHCGAKMDGVEE